MKIVLVLRRLLYPVRSTTTTIARRRTSQHLNCREMSVALVTAAALAVGAPRLQPTTEQMQPLVTLTKLMGTRSKSAVGPLVAAVSPLLTQTLPASAAEQAQRLSDMTFEPRGITPEDTVIFILGTVPFVWAGIEFWRRIAVGDPFGTGSDSVIINDTSGNRTSPACQHLRVTQRSIRWRQRSVRVAPEWAEAASARCRHHWVPSQAPELAGHMCWMLILGQRLMWASVSTHVEAGEYWDAAHRACFCPPGAPRARPGRNHCCAYPLCACLCLGCASDHRRHRRSEQMSCATCRRSTTTHEVHE